MCIREYIVIMLVAIFLEKYRAAQGAFDVES